MFENIIEQGAVLQLRDDILNNRNAPSMLFFGPPDSGKGSAALELARVLSCEEKASWNCSCPSCKRHKYLAHDDLLVLGKRVFAAEISACNSAFLRDPSNQKTKTVFCRSLRKLQIRFSPTIMEDDQKTAKAVVGILQSLDEDLNEFESLDTQTCDKTSLEKLCLSLVKNALKLEEEGISDLIPVNHIRSASYWCRLSPAGKHKTLIIENAENMRDEARNSLLKLLEEPPTSVTIVLTAQRREAILATLLSRLRPYRFLRRSIESEKEVIRRVFQDNEFEKTFKENSFSLSAYLDSFLVHNTNKLYPLAAWFIVSLARIISRSAGSDNIPVIIKTLGERYAPIAESAGFERSLKSTAVIKTIISQSKNFEDASFSRFMKITLDLICEITRAENSPQYILYYDIFKKYINDAVTSVEILNINTTIALESLFYNLKKAVIRGQYG
ncbi:MAG: DNA polymerase III [Treponema sp.]|jgi:DNA polymerase-3 subunit gamma/tau|nr:DNA polymerase III [Treponema sp.]